MPNDRATDGQRRRAPASHRHPPPRRPHRRRRRCHHHDRHISQRPDPLRRAAISRRTLRRTGRRAAGRGAEAAWPARMPAQDRNAAAPRRPHHRLVEVSGAARRRRSHAVQLSHQAGRASRLAGALLHRLDHAGDASHHPRKCSSLADVQRADPIRSGRAIALRSKTRSSSFPTRSRTSSSSSPRA